MDPEKKIWLPLPPQKRNSQAKKEKHSNTTINFKFFPCFCKYFFCFLFFVFISASFELCRCLFFICFFIPCRVFFCFLFFCFCFLFFTFYFLFLQTGFCCFLLCFHFLFCFAFLFLFVLLFVRFFCWNQTCWFLRTNPVLVKINCLDLGCVKHIGLTDTPLSQHDFLRCFVTVVLRNFPCWHRDGLRQRQDRGCFLSLKQLGSWRQKHGMEEEIQVLYRIWRCPSCSTSHFFVKL